MRLDLFLKASRLCSRRTLAQQTCEAGRVSVNNSVAKSSHVIKPGDEITLRSQSTIKKVRVLSVPSKRQISRREASGLYETISEEALESDLIAEPGVLP